MNQNIDKIDTGILITPFEQSYHYLDQAMKDIKWIQYTLDQANISRTDYNRVTSQEFVQMCRNGTPHAMGSWKFSERTRNRIKEYRTNYYMFNLNDLSSVHPHYLHQVLSGVMNGPFRFIQESFSSGHKPEEKRYHLYLPVTELEDVDFEEQQLIYEWVRDDLELKLGVKLDQNTYLQKNILASNYDVLVNEDAPVYDLMPYVNEIKRVEKMLAKRQKRVSKQEVICHSVEEDFKKKYIVPIVDYNELLKAFQTEDFATSLDYRDKCYLFMALNTMEHEGQITEQQKLELAEAIISE